MSAISDCEAAIRAAQTNLQDAREREQKAAKARSAAEAVHATAQGKRDEAVARSASNPDDDRLLTKESNEERRLGHARRALERAVHAHDALRREVANCEQRLADADRQLVRAKFEAELHDPQRSIRARQRGTRLVEACVELFELLRERQDDLAEERALARRAQELGVPAGDIPDGLQDTVGALEALLARERDLGPISEPHPIRWAMAASADGHIDPLTMARNTTAIVFDALSRSASVKGTAGLRSAIDEWGPHRAFAGALRAKAARDELEAKSRATSVVALAERQKLETMARSARIRNSEMG